VLVAIPFFLGIVMLYGAQARAAIEASAGHKLALEHRINDLLGNRRVLCWEETAKSVIVQKTPQMLFTYALVALFLGSFAMAGFVAWQHWGLWTVVVMAALVVLAEDTATEGQAANPGGRPALRPGRQPGAAARLP
jgi:hypothetical protein